ncbi:aminoglycoside phosphotransferase family protein [Streptomyces sp. NPDC001890]|uniref:aminoglycoside phosphotransferase family protein n=1 Tax=Streptomyces sp. NPDC001890 TaxID=3364620 RepID=UPI0036D04B28
MNHPPAEAAAREAARQLGLSTRSLTTLHTHATAVFLLPAEDLVLRVSPAVRITSLTRAVTLMRWLSQHGLPVPEAADLSQPVLVSGHAVTLWTHYSQRTGTGTPGAEHLGTLLKQLHALPEPPLDLPAWQPLSSLHQALKDSTALRDDQKEWLLTRRAELLGQYRQLEFPLGTGLLHGDAYPGNCLWDETTSPPTVRLGDWDEASTGPREIDLANTYQGVRFGRTEGELSAFSDSYGYDITTWPGLPVLTQIRSMHTLGAYIKRADRNDQRALDQLNFRISTLQSNTAALWSAT